MTNFYKFNPQTHEVYEKDGVEFVRRKDSDMYLIYMLERPGITTNVKNHQLKDAKKILVDLARDMDGWED